METPVKPDELGTPAEPDKMEAPLPTLEVPQEPTKPAKPAIKHGRGRPQKYPVTKSTMTENHPTSTGISIKQSPPIKYSPPADILVLILEIPFIDL